MLAKLWKKVLLAVCIVAILFNVTNKLMRKTNLKSELQSVIGGNAISFFNQDSTQTLNTTSKNSTENQEENQ